MEPDWTGKLETWNLFPEYLNWIYSTYQQYLGDRVADIGAGIGNMTIRYLGKASLVVAVDVVDKQVAFMEDTFKSYKNFIALKLNVMTDDISALAKYNFDTVVCVNVIEHIENDFLFLEKLASLVCPGGHIVVFAPAMPFLYNIFDKNNGHYRRYKRTQLRSYGKKLGLKICKDRYFNFFGVFLLYLKGKRAEKLSANVGITASSTLHASSGKRIDIATKVLRPLEALFPPVMGISKVVVYQKPSS